MDKIFLGDVLLLDIGKLVKSNTIKGIEFVSSDPGVSTDNKIYLISDTNVDNYIRLRYNSTLFKIGEIDQPI